MGSPQKWKTSRRPDGQEGREDNGFPRIPPGPQIGCSTRSKGSEGYTEVAGGPLISAPPVGEPKSQHAQPELHGKACEGVDSPPTHHNTVQGKVGMKNSHPGVARMGGFRGLPQPCSGNNVEIFENMSQNKQGNMFLDIISSYG